MKRFTLKITIGVTVGLALWFIWNLGGEGFVFGFIGSAIANSFNYEN